MNRSALDSRATRPELRVYLEQLRVLHVRLCPRQVLGVRMGMAAGAALELDVPRSDKRILVLAETDGCLTDGIGVSTGCWVGHRSLRVVDLGKVAATFVDTRSCRAVRIWPHPRSRGRAVARVPDAPSHWHAQLLGYQLMSDADLLCIQHVEVTIPLAAVLGRPGVRIVCDVCGEEVLNQREVRLGTRLVCRACAGERYYNPVAPI